MEPTPEQTALMAKNWRDLIRPRTLEIEERSDTYGKFSCEPLERGFGTTLGVSLRRVLLSSLQGAAISHVAVDGALHEFTSLPGVVEDVTDIILNLKETLFRVEADKTYTVRLDKQGDGIVTAGDIALVDGVTCLNPNHRICNSAIKRKWFEKRSRVNVGFYIRFEKLLNVWIGYKFFALHDFPNFKNIGRIGQNISLEIRYRIALL